MTNRGRPRDFSTSRATRSAQHDGLVGGAGSSGKIAQARVSRLDQAKLLRTRPTFDLFLARDRGSCIRKMFEIQKSPHSVLCGEARTNRVLVFEHSAVERICDSHVEHSASTAHDVDVEIARKKRAHPSAHGFSAATSNTPLYVFRGTSSVILSGGRRVHHAPQRRARCFDSARSALRST